MTTLDPDLSKLPFVVRRAACAAQTFDALKTTAVALEVMTCRLMEDVPKSEEGAYIFTDLPEAKREALLSLMRILQDARKVIAVVGEPDA